jgi:hypothetical protein
MYPVKRLAKNLSRSLPPVKVFVDDIKTVIDIMSKASDNPTFALSTDQYSLDDLKWLEELKGQKVGELNITLVEPRIDVSIMSSGVLLWTWQETPAIRGVLDEVAEFLVSKRRKFSWKEKGILKAFYALFAFSFIVLMAQFIVGLGWLLYVCGLGFFVALVLFIRMFTVKSSIIPEKRVERKSFLERNRDQVIVAIVTAALTFVATLLGTWAAGLLRSFP